MRSLSASLSLLLYSSSALALPTLLNLDGQNGSVSPFSEVQPLERRAGRSSQFMQNFVKGAQLWGQYLDSIMAPNSIPPSTDFPMEWSEMPSTIDSPAVPGWELRQEDSDDDSGMEWFSVPVDRDGWRYEEIEIHWGDDLETSLDIIAENLNPDFDPDFKAYECTQWRTPFISLTLNIDCENGIVVSHNADLKYTDESGQIIRSSHRWSDLTWKLWVTVCPKEQHHNLQYIIRETITNADTQAALAEAATARGKLDPQNPKANHLVNTVYTPDLDFNLDKSVTPTCNQETGECDFYSLLRAPNVIGVVYLLIAHANTLSYPYISHMVSQSVEKTVPGKTWTGWNMVIKLDKAPC